MSLFAFRWLIIHNVRWISANLAKITFAVATFSPYTLFKQICVEEEKLNKVRHKPANDNVKVSIAEN